MQKWGVFSIVSTYLESISQYVTTAEKALKALYTSQRQEHAPPIHNLLRLARMAGVEPDEMQTEALITITAFNIEARYPDIKRAFRERCTPELTARQMATVKEVFRWLRSLML